MAVSDSSIAETNRLGLSRITGQSRLSGAMRTGAPGRQPPSKDATHRALPRRTPSAGAAATDVGRTLIQTPGSQFSAFLALRQTPEELGDVGGFRILRLIGEGGMGFVFEGEDLKLERRVAIKVMGAGSGPAAGRCRAVPARSAHSRGPRKRSRRHHSPRPSAAARRAVSRHAADGGRDAARPDASRADLDRRDNPHRPRKAAQGSAAAHAAGLIHRDIKPANIWLEAPTGRGQDPRLRPGPRRQRQRHYTQTRQVLGTPQYMAPEQARGKPVDARGRFVQPRLSCTA